MSAAVSPGRREEGRRPGRQRDGCFGGGDLLVAIFIAGIGVEPAQMTTLAVATPASSNRAHLGSIRHSVHACMDSPKLGLAAGRRARAKLKSERVPDRVRANGCI
jgi:hypothetical protein